MPLLCLCCDVALAVRSFVARWQQHRFIMRVFLFTLTNVPWQVGNFLFKWVSLRNSSLPPTLCVLIFLLIFNQHFTLFKVEKYQKVFWCPLYLQRNRPKILELTETFTWSSWQSISLTIQRSENLEKKIVVLDSSKKWTLGQFYVLIIPPAFVFWKNPGRHYLLLRFTDL